MEAERRRLGVLPVQADTRRLPDGLTEGLVPVEAPAGSVLVIDSDVVHRGMPVVDGERLAVRSRSYRPEYAPRPQPVPGTE